MKNLAFQNLCRLKNDYTINSHYRTYTFLFKGWENVLSELRSERLSYSWRCGVPIVMWCKTSRICSAELTGHFLRQHHRVRLLRDVFLTFQAAVVLENVVDGEWHGWLMMTGDVIFWEIKSVHIISFVLPLYTDKPAIRLVESENVIFGLAILSASVWFQFVFIVIFVLGELTFSRCNMRHTWLSLSGWFSWNLVRCHFERKTVFGRLIVSIRSSFEKVVCMTHDDTLWLWLQCWTLSRQENCSTFLIHKCESHNDLLFFFLGKQDGASQLDQTSIKKGYRHEL